MVKSVADVKNIYSIYKQRLGEKASECQYVNVTLTFRNHPPWEEENSIAE